MSRARRSSTVGPAARRRLKRPMVTAGPPDLLRVVGVDDWAWQSCETPIDHTSITREAPIPSVSVRHIWYLNNAQNSALSTRESELEW